MSRQSYAEVWTYTDLVTENLKAAKNLEVTVYKAGTSEKATIYEAREGGSAKSNPFISKENGLVLFWANTGEYDIEFHDTILPNRFGDFIVGWLSAPLNVEIEAKELSDNGSVTWSQEVNGAWVPTLKDGIVGLDELSNSAFIPSSRLDAAAQTTLFQSGDIKSSARPSAPSGWLLCDGSSKLRSEYATLFSSIGTTYGTADGTHFNLPNIIGRTQIGAGTGSGLSARTMGSSGGEESHKLTEAEMPSHSHGVNDPGHEHGILAANFNEWSASGNQSTTVPIATASLFTLNAQTGITIQAKGGGGSHNNMQPFTTVNFFIKT